MKYTLTIALSVLLLGVCYARSTFDQNHANEYDFVPNKDKSQGMDDTRMMEDYRHADERSRQADERAVSPYSELKDMVVQKISQIYRKFSGGHKSVNTFHLEELPTFVDPFELGSFTKTFSGVTVEYRNVQLRGFAQGGYEKAYTVSVNVHPHSQQAELMVYFKNCKIDGQYVVFDSAKRTPNEFELDLSDSVVYVLGLKYQTQQNGRFNFDIVKRQMKYGHRHHHYENIASFSNIFDDNLSEALLQSIVPKIGEEVYAKFADQLQQKFGQYAQNEYGGNKYGSEYGNEYGSDYSGQMDKALKEGIENIQQTLAQNGATSLELTSDDKEMVFHQLHAKIASVKLHGLEKFFLAENHISYENDKLNAKVQLAIKRPTATAMVTVQDSQDENAPFQKINVDFDMEHIYAELGLAKRSSTSDMELRSVETYAHQLRPMNADKFEGEVQTMINQKLSSQVKKYIEEGLKTFIREEVAAIMARDVMPSRMNERQYA